METTFINYTEPSPPSLKNTAIVTIVTWLFAHPDVKKELLLLLKFSKIKAKHKFCEVEKIMMEKIILTTHKSLHHEIINFVRPIGLQLLRCFDRKEKELYNLYNHSQPDGSLVWTSNGTIDKIQTLKRRILEENRKKDYSFLFELACKYCYEEYMLELWEKMPMEYQRKLWNESEKGNYLTTYWINQLRSKFPFYFEYLNEPFYFPLPGTGMK